MKWKWCPGYEGRYEVSSTGIVRSWVSPGPSGRSRATPLILKPNRAGGRNCEYLQVQLGSRNQKYVHRLVVEAFIGEIPSGLEVDHINQDSTDNRLENLRLVTRQQNCVRARRARGSTSKYKGVWIDRRNGAGWIAAITVNRKSLHLGYFATEEEAALAYDDKARELHGEFAHTNFPHTGNS